MNVQTVGVAEFRIADLGPGKHRFRIGVPGGEASWAALVLSGERKGPTLLVTAGIHGDEYEGMRAIHEVFGRTDPAQLVGTLAAIPVVNEPAYRNNSRLSPIDGLDLARSFPGKPDGSVTQRVAHALQAYVFPQADLICDLHSAGMHYEIHPLAGYMLVDPDRTRRQRAAAVAFGLGLVWGTPQLDGRSLSAARDCGQPAIYVEMPGRGLCLPEHVRLDVEGVLNVMGYLEMLPDRPFPGEPVSDFLEETAPGAGHLQVQCTAEHDGFFIPSRRLWDSVKIGETIGNLYSEAGDPLQAITADRAGRVLILRTTPSIREGEFCAAVIGLG